MSAATPIDPAIPASVPASWKSALGQIPQAYREAALAFAIAEHTELTRADHSSRGGAERRSLLETTPLCGLLHAGFAPWHLARDEETRQTLRVTLRTSGSSAAAQLLAAVRREADAVMVLGDTVTLDALTTQLNLMAAARPMLWLMAGPGVATENIALQYAERHDLCRMYVRSVDESGGECWAGADPDTTKRRVVRLFREHRPDRILLFEPIRTAAVQMALEEARRLGLPITTAQAGPAIGALRRSAAPAH